MVKKIVCEYCKEFNNTSEFDDMDAYRRHLKTQQHEIDYNAIMGNPTYYPKFFRRG